MHHIYHTEGIILESRNFGEDSKYYSIFTRDFGLVFAIASGVRKMSSKLRFVLQDYSYVKVDLVQGKNIFRITSASKINQLEKITKRKETFEVLVNISQLLRRLLTGVEPNEALFEDLVRGLSMLETAETKDDLRNIEAIVVLRIVHNLGYIGGDEELQKIIRSPLAEDVLFEAAKNRRKILTEINKALRETHL